MNWAEFQRARLLMAEERVGAPLRDRDRGELAQDEATKAILRERGLVS
jgi:hypothetical protein